MIETIATTPFEGQRPGTSGLRKKTRSSKSRAISRILSSRSSTASKALKARRSSSAAMDASSIARRSRSSSRWRIANGFGRILVGQRRHIVDARRLESHPPKQAPSAASSSAPVTIRAGPKGDFGIKYNVGNGGPAPEKLTEAMFASSKSITRYSIVDGAGYRSRHAWRRSPRAGEVEVIDPVARLRGADAAAVRFRQDRAACSNPVSVFVSTRCPR